MGGRGSTGKKNGLPARHSRWRIALAGTVLIASTGLGAPAIAEEEAGQTELERLRGEILEARERVGSEERQEREILERLEAIERGVELLVESVARAERDAAEKRTLLEAATKREAHGIARLTRTRAAMARRAVALYKNGELGPVRVLFSARSMPELFARASMLEQVLEYDAALVDRYAGELAEFETARREARESAKAHAEALAQFEARSQALVEERKAKTQLLASVRENRASARAILVELEKAAIALEETLAAIGENSLGTHMRRDQTDFASQKGALPWPTRAPIRGRFGRVVDADYLTETFRKGIEIAARAGKDVRAIAFGEVRFAGWFRGYGKIVILDHGGEYFTVSGHLDRVDVELGQLIAQGEVLGSVGETGSFKGPALYFEVRRGGEPLDPAEWLAP